MTDLDGNEVMTLDGLDDALLGVTEDRLAVYSYAEIHQILMDRDGMDAEGAEEWIDYNICGFIQDRAPYPILVFPLDA